MFVLIGYATTEGQTAKIARHVARRITEAGHSAELLPLGEAGGLSLAPYDRVILASSIHLGHYHRALSDFTAAHATELPAKPSLLLSVSLAAAGHEAEDWRALDKIATDLAAATGWTPDEVAQVAGAYMPSRYDIFRRFVMRRIVAAQDPGADLDADHEYTDWPDLDRRIDAWLDRPSAKETKPGT